MDCSNRILIQIPNHLILNMKTKTTTDERPLNLVQRKMLDKIYSEEMDLKARNYSNERQLKRNALIKTLVAKESAKHKVILKKASAMAKELIKLENKLEKTGFRFNKSMSANAFVIEYTGGSTYSYSNSRSKNPEIIKFDNETNASKSRLNDLKNEIRADIYGLQITYSEIRTELDNKISKLKLA